MKKVWKEKKIIGIGTNSITDPDILYELIKNGARLIDITSKNKSWNYLKGIKRAIDDCIVRREDLFIIGKVTLENKNDPEKHLRNILDYANISYLDLYLDVLPYSKDHIKNSKENHFKPISIYEFWQKMEELVKKGLVKSLGVCNYNIQCLSNLISFCQIRPVVNEIEFNPYNYQIFKNIKEFYDKEQII